MTKTTIKTKDEAKNLLMLAISAGNIMLMNGAETYRVEDTVERICSSRKGVSNVSSFVTPTGIFVSLEFDDEMFTYLKRVKNIGINLNKINMINDFSRCFVNSQMTIHEGISIIDNIKETKAYSPLIKSFFGAIAAALFSLMFGGTIKDCISSFFISFIVINILEKLSKLKLTFFIDNFIGALLASLFALVSIKIKVANNIDSVIIGSIMYLVPGVAITNSVRDTMSGDFISGLSRGMEAIFAALAIAFGVGIILNFYLKGVSLWI